MFYKTQNSYAPSADTLSVDIKDKIEYYFPTLNKHIINDAVAHGTNEYIAYLLTEPSKLASDQEAEDFFFNSVMERIIEHNRREHETLMTLMLAQQRHFQSPLTPNSDLSSGFLTLNSHQQDKIFEENRKKFIPMPPPRFPRPGNKVTGYPNFLWRDKIRIPLFLSLRDKLKKQLGVIERLTTMWPTDVSENILIAIFDEVYRLQLQDLKSNDLERLIIESVSRIIRDSNYLSREKKRAFMLFFSSTINTPENIMYCRKMAEKMPEL